MVESKEKKVIDWLLEEDNPPVRYLTLKHLVKDDKQALEAKKHLMEYEVTQAILQHLDEFLNYDKDYWKYKGKYWQLIFLGQFLADGRDPSVAKIADTILANRKWIWHFGGQCLAANILAALTKLGYGDHPLVTEETEKLARQIAAERGIKCGIMDYSLLPRCYMAIPKVLLCFAEVPSKRRSRAVEDAVDILVNILLENEVYIYVPANRGAWHKILEKQPKRAELPEGQTVKAWTLKQKERFLNSSGLGSRDEKRGWLKFGFPLHYNSDILEAMVALARLKIPANPNLARPLHVIEEKMTDNGKWIMENSLNGKMWADVETKGKSSKWLTYFALYVLDHFNASD